MVAVDFHVVVEPDAFFLPLGEDVGLRRQRLQGGAVQFPVQLHTGAGQFAERSLVQLVEQFADGLVELGQAEELALAQRRHDPTLYQ